jgi:hypothetical protein
MARALRWSPPLASHWRAAGAGVVADAGQTTSAASRHAPNSLDLMASLSPPVGRRGRGPLCYAAHVEVATVVRENSVGTTSVSFQRDPFGVE